MPSVDLSMGRIHYEEAGPADGRPVVCIHGFLMSAALWDDLRPRLGEQGLRCITPTMPMGAHPEAMKPGADVTPRGQARIIAELLEKLDLDDVVLVGNDSGGAVCQVAAAHHPARLGALVLTNCDTLEHFPPSFLKALVPAARIPGVLRATLTPMRVGALRRSPLGYGLLSHRGVDDLASTWVRTLFGVEGAFEDCRRFVGGMGAAVTRDAARRLRGFDGPIVLAWGSDDRLFTTSQAERFVAEVPGSRLVRIAGSRTFVMVDQPERLAEIVGEVAGVKEPAAA